MSISVDGKTCIVTGSGSGLGKAIAEALVKAHANVVICDINNERLETVSKELSSHGSVLAVQTDITLDASIQNLFDKAISTFGKVDVLVNNAGIMDRFQPVGDMDRKTWDRILATNLTAPFELSKIFVNHVLSREGAKGAIVNISSVAGVLGFRGGSAYTASKHALVGLTKNTAAFYGKKGIRCNAILPGGMATNLVQDLIKDPHKEGFEIIGRIAAVDSSMCEVDEVANFCLYLCSDQSNVLNGACVNADRGWAAY